MNTTAQSNINPINQYPSCTAIFGGILVSLTAGLILDLLGMAIGFSLFSPTKDVLYSLSIGAVGWVLFSTISAMYAGGWTAGYYSPNRAPGNGVLYGVIVSSISIFVFLVLTLSGIGTIVNTSFSGLRYAISEVSNTAKESGTAINTAFKNISHISPELTEKAKRAIPDLKPVTDKVQQKAFEFLPQDAPEKIKTGLESVLNEYLASTGKINHEELREKLIASLTEATGKSSDEINQKIEEWQNLYNEAKEQAYQAVVSATENAAKAVGQFALLNFFILTSGIIAAIWGGINGIKRKRNY